MEMGKVEVRASRQNTVPAACDGRSSATAHAIIHSREPTDGRPGRSMLVGVRLTPRVYVSPAATHAPARRRRSVMPAVDWRVDPSFAAIRSQAKANGARLVPAAAGCPSEPHVCARIYQGMYSFHGPPTCLFWRRLCGCPDAGGAPGWIRSGVLYSGPNRSE